MSRIGSSPLARFPPEIFRPSVAALSLSLPVAGGATALASVAIVVVEASSIASQRTRGRVGTVDVPVDPEADGMAALSACSRSSTSLSSRKTATSELLSNACEPSGLRSAAMPAGRGVEATNSDRMPRAGGSQSDVRPVRCTASESSAAGSDTSVENHGASCGDHRPSELGAGLSVAIATPSPPRSARCAARSGRSPPPGTWCRRAPARDRST